MFPEKKNETFMNKQKMAKSKFKLYGNADWAYIFRETEERCQYTKTVYDLVLVYLPLTNRTQEKATQGKRTHIEKLEINQAHATWATEPGEIERERDEDGDEDGEWGE